MSELKTLLTLEEAARHLAVSKTTLRRWTNDGTLACHRIGPREERRFEPEALKAFLARGAGESPSGGAAIPPLGLLEEPDTATRHVCLYLARPEERWEAFRPYFLRHFHAGEPTIYLHSASTREELLEHMRGEGLDPHDAARRGLLQLIHARDSYLREGVFSPDAMISFLRRLIVRQRADGYPALLITGEMDWFFSDCPGTESLHEYETRLNDLLAEFPEATIVCQYDLSRFGGLDIVQACCSHPAVLFHRRLHRGFYRAASS
jgi:excisionase family DNA binding protein